MPILVTSMRFLFKKNFNPKINITNKIGWHLCLSSKGKMPQSAWCANFDLVYGHSSLSLSMSLWIAISQRNQTLPIQVALDYYYYFLGFAFLILARFKQHFRVILELQIKDGNLDEMLFVWPWPNVAVSMAGGVRGPCEMKTLGECQD